MQKSHLNNFEKGAIANNEAKMFRQKWTDGFREGLGGMGMSEFYGPHDDAQSIATIHRALEPDHPSWMREFIRLLKQKASA